MYRARRTETRTVNKMWSNTRHAIHLLGTQSHDFDLKCIVQIALVIATGIVADMLSRDRSPIV